MTPDLSALAALLQTGGVPLQLAAIAWVILELRRTTRLCQELTLRVLFLETEHMRLHGRARTVSSEVNPQAVP